MPTKLDSSIELRLPSISFIVYSSKRQTSWPTCTAFILFTHGRSTPIFTDLFRPSLRLPSQQFLSLPPLPPVIRLLLPPSSMHHHSVPLHKHPQPPPLHHHYHNPRRNANLHHPSKKMLIGTLGMATLKFAWWNSKPMPACDQTGITLLVEWASQLNSAKHVGKHNANIKQSSYRPHPHLLHPPTRHHLFLLSLHLPPQQQSHHRHPLQLRTSRTLLQHLHHLHRLPQPLTDQQASQLTTAILRIARRAAAAAATNMLGDNEP